MASSMLSAFKTMEESFSYSVTLGVKGSLSLAEHISFSNRGYCSIHHESITVHTSNIHIPFCKVYPLQSWKKLYVPSSQSSSSFCCNLDNDERLFPYFSPPFVWIVWKQESPPNPRVSVRKCFEGNCYLNKRKTLFYFTDS